MDVKNIGGASINILEDLYHGNVNPNEKQFDRSSHYAKSCQILSDNEQKLTALLATLPNAKNEQHFLLQMINAQAEISGYNEQERFIEGFCLGARFVLDTFVIRRIVLLEILHKRKQRTTLLAM